MDTTKPPQITTDAIILLESNFIRYPENPSVLVPTIEIAYESTLIDQRTGHGLLTVIASGVAQDSGHKVFESRIRFLGVFLTEDDNPNLPLEDFLKVHAPAHIYPYAREFLTSLSTRSGMPPLILPPLNMAALLKVQIDGEVHDQTIDIPPDAIK